MKSKYKVKQQGGLLKPLKPSSSVKRDKTSVRQNLIDNKVLPNPNSKFLDEDSALTNVLEIFDPIGISSYDDVKREYDKSGASAGTTLELAGALPIIGKVGKGIKLLKGFSKIEHVEKLANPLLKYLDVLDDITPASKQVSQFTGNLLDNISNTTKKYNVNSGSRIVNGVNTGSDINGAVNYRQQGGMGNQVIIEKGELGKDMDGNIISVDSKAPSHDDPYLVHETGMQKATPGKGGVIASNLESVLSDSQTQINSGERANNVKDDIIKIRPSEAKMLAEQLGLTINVAQSVSPTKLFKVLQTARDKQAKKYTIDPAHKKSIGKPFAKSQEINTLQQSQLPNDSDLYDILFEQQEQAKQAIPDFEELPDQNMQHGGLNKLGVKNSLWNNIRAKKGSGKAPTKEMLAQERKINSKQQGGYNKSEQLARQKQFFSPELSTKYKIVEDKYRKKYPSDTKTLKSLERYREQYGDVYPEDFNGDEYSRKFPVFDKDYQIYQRQLLDTNPDEAVEFVHNLSGIRNPMQLLTMKTPSNISKMDMVKLGLKIKKDQRTNTFQSGGSTSKLDKYL